VLEFEAGLVWPRASSQIPESAGTPRARSRRSRCRKAIAPHRPHSAPPSTGSSRLSPAAPASARGSASPRAAWTI